jgi:hypothetical protein
MKRLEDCVVFCLRERLGWGNNSQLGWRREGGKRVGKREYAKIVDGYMSPPMAIGRFQRTNSCHNLRIASSPVSGVALSVPFSLLRGLCP